MKRFFCLVFVIIGFSSFAFSQKSEKAKEAFEISDCRASLTKAGRQSNFSWTYVYTISTDEKGLVKRVIELTKSKTSLVDDKNIIPCIKKWKLKSSKNYVVSVKISPTGTEFLSISNKGDKIKINYLPNAEIKNDEKQITVCPIKLLVGAADFRFSYRYIAKIDEKGAVSKVEQLNKDNPKFVNDEEFIPCIKSWKLNSSENYFISINVGTIFTDPNYILITSKKELIKINIRSIGMELIVEDKKK